MRVCNRLPGLFLFISLAAEVCCYVFLSPLAAILVFACTAAFCIFKWNVFSCRLLIGVSLGLLLSNVNAPVEFSNPGMVQQTYLATVERGSVSSLSPEVKVRLHGDNTMKAVLKISDSPYYIRTGDVIRFRCAFMGVEDITELPHRDGLRMNYLSQCVSAVAYVEGNEVQLLGHSSNPLLKLRRRSEDMALALNSLGMSQNNTALLGAAFFGGNLATEHTRQTFRSVGLAHLLCISGFHVGLVAAFFSILLWPLKLSPKFWNLRQLILIALVWLYISICGFTPAAVRAGGMISAVLLCSILNCDHYSLNSLFLGCFVVLIFNPYYLFSAGFHLSAIATAALLCFCYELNPTPKNPTSLTARIYSLFSIPLIIVFVAGPLLLYYFHRIPLTMIPASAIGVVLFPLFMLCGAWLVAFKIMGFDFTLLADFCNMIGDMLDKVCVYLEHIGSEINIIAYPTELQCASALMAFLFLAIFTHTDKKKWKIGSMGLFVVLLLLIPFLSTTQLSMVFISSDAVFGTDDNKGTIIAFNNKTGANYSDFFAGERCSEVRRIFNYGAGTVNCCGMSVYLLQSGSTDSIISADVLFLKNNVRVEDVNRIINRNTFSHIVCAPWVSDEVINLVRVHGMSSGIPVYELKRNRYVRIK